MLSSTRQSTTQGAMRLSNCSVIGMPERSFQQALRRVKHQRTSLSVGSFAPSRQALRRSQKSCRMRTRSEEHTSELQSPCNLVCRLLLEKKTESTCLRSCRSQKTRNRCSTETDWHLGSCYRVD